MEITIQNSLARSAEWEKHCEKLKRPYCVRCLRPEKQIDYYIMNPPGGYGKEEILICTDCLRKPENADILKSLKDRGFNDLEEFYVESKTSP